MTVAMAARIAREKRVILIPLVTALAANALLAGLVVYPLSQRVSSAAQQETQAAATLRSAEAEHTTAAATLEHKERAEADLARFYTEVLPASVSAARRQTYVRLARLATDADLEYLRRLEEVQPPKASGAGPSPVLTRFEITMVLRGEYDSVRQFVRDVEASEEFVSIDDISLAEGAEPGSPLVLSLVMSTYFRAGGDAR